MMRKMKTALFIVLPTCFLWLASCSGGDTAPGGQHAQSLLGGSLAAFSGADGDDPDARAVAREMATGRLYDFTPSGFTVAAGTVTTLGVLGSDFGDATGTLAVNGDVAQVTYEPEVLSGDATLPQMTGTFSVAEAQAAIDNPGTSFPVTWEFTWVDGTGSHDLSADQQLTGTDFSS